MTRTRIKEKPLQFPAGASSSTARLNCASPDRYQRFVTEAAINLP